MNHKLRMFHFDQHVFNSVQFFEYTAVTFEMSTYHELQHTTFAFDHSFQILIDLVVFACVCFVIAELNALGNTTRRVQ